MKQYDYTGNVDMVENLFDEMEQLDFRQQTKLKDYIESIKSTKEEEKIVIHTNWFHTAIFPIINGFAESTASLLTIEEDDSGIINAVIKSPQGLEISERSQGLYLALIAASYMIIDKDDGHVIVSLIYDPQKFPY